MTCYPPARLLNTVAIVLCFSLAPWAMAQQPPQAQPLPPAGEGHLPPVQVQQSPVQVPAGFELNALQQTFLDQVLDAWQRESAKITTFKCSFERLDYNLAFAPAPNIPLSIDKGELSYHKPDRGSFQITEVRKWQAKPATPDRPPGQIQGDWVLQKDAISEHWVCDGKSVFEYRQDQKQLVERPIPVQMQGQAIVDGPLPFLFGAEAAKLKARYWLRVVDQPNQNEIWLEVLPRYQADAANYTKVEVILDQQQVLPKAMQVHLPGQSRQVYKFDLANASINSPLARLEAMFQRPRTPLGWKRVVEEIPPQQAAQPDQPPR